NTKRAAQPYNEQLSGQREIYMAKRDLIGIIADTHDNRRAIANAVELFNQRGAGMVFHAGDFIAPFTAIDFSKLQCKMMMVFGNNDGEKIGLYHAFSKLGEIVEGPKTCEYLGKRFILMHEPTCMDELSASHQADVIIYGHTHEIDIRKGETLIINPGEGGGWLTGRATAALLDLTTMDVTIEEIG
ncbi:MAG: metallophosphoesterase, partial [Deltaproteobacteria bacterium]|nr:metallophosphoesterase [Deltaproteobacteria bacterium]